MLVDLSERMEGVVLVAAQAWVALTSRFTPGWPWPDHGGLTAVRPRRVVPRLRDPAARADRLPGPAVQEVPHQSGVGAELAVQLRRGQPRDRSRSRAAI